MRNCALFAIVLLVAGSPALADSGVKIGFVNSKIIMEQAPQAEQAQKKLEREFSTREASLKADASEIVELEKKMKKDGVIMSDSQHAELERKIQKKRREFERGTDELREDLNIRRSEELSQLQREVSKVIKEIAEEEKYDIIMAENHLVFASKKIDITDQILKRLMSSFKGK